MAEGREAAVDRGRGAAFRETVAVQGDGVRLEIAEALRAQAAVPPAEMGCVVALGAGRLRG